MTDTDTAARLSADPDAHPGPVALPGPHPHEGRHVFEGAGQEPGILDRIEKELGRL